MTMRLRSIIFVCFLLATAVHVRAAEELRAKLLASPDKLVPGGAVQLTVEIEIVKPWHINANPASADLIPTEVKFDLPAGLSVTKITYPPGESVRMSWSDTVVALYTGKIVITAAGQVRPDVPPGPLTIKAAVSYQACNDKICVAPQTVPLTLNATVVAGPSGGNGVPAATGRADSENSIESLVHERGWALVFVFVFLGGLALNLTPCVYPMIAITVSYFGGQGERRISTAFARALTYCLGIVLTYSALGLAAALTGGLFGALLQSPVVLIGIAVLLVALALSMFGLYELQPPSFLMQQAAGLSSKAGYIGVFLLGATVGIIAAPCLGPIILSVFVFVAQRGDPWLGWWLFFTLACGLGLPYVVLGTFSGLLARLPKSGTWMVWIKRVFGVALIGVAIWFVMPLLSTKATTESPISWQPYSAELIAHPGRPVLIDFYADWCIPCHEMDKRTFTDPRIIEASKKFLMVRADLTKTTSPEAQKLTEQYQIAGVPTFVFLDPAGHERTTLRHVGFVPATELLAVMNQALTIGAVTTNAASNPAAEIPASLLRQF